MSIYSNAFLDINGDEYVQKYVQEYISGVQKYILVLKTH